MKKEKWEIKKLGEICGIVNGKNQNKVESPSGIYPIMGSGGVIGFADDYLCPEGTTILGRKGTINKPFIVDQKVWIVDTAFGLVANPDELISSYLSYFCKSYDFIKLNVAVTIPSLRKVDIKEIPIPIPPLSVQEAIVKELDTLHRIKELQEQQLAEYDTLAQATFYSMFGDPIENEKGWEVKKLGEVCEFNNGKAHENTIDENGKFIVVNSKFIASDGTVIKRTNNQLSPLYIGEIAMVMSDVPNGRAIAKCFIIDKDNLYSLNQRICSLASSSFQTVFMYYLINRHEYFLSFDNGNSQTNLRKNDILNCDLIIPPLSLQTQFAERIEKIEAQKELVKQSIAETQMLIDYTMDKYFG